MYRAAPYSRVYVKRLEFVTGKEKR